MKKILTFLLVAVCLGPALHAQSVAINTDGSAPHPNAALDIKSQAKGLLLPRLSEAERLAVKPLADAKGLLVYQTDGTSGFYHWDGSAWLRLGSGDAVPTPSDQWLTNGTHLNNKNSGRIGIGDGGAFWPLAKVHIRTDSGLDSLHQLVLEEAGDDYARLSWRNGNSNRFWTMAGYTGTTPEKDWLNIYNRGYGDLLTFTGRGETLFRDSGYYASNGSKVSVTYNSGVDKPQLLLYERDSLDFARISFMNKGNDNFWTLAATQHLNDTITRWNVYHSKKGDLLTVAATGNVGVSNVLPQHRLDVAGNINVPTDSSYRIGGLPVVLTKGDDNLMLGKNNVSKLTGRWNTFTGHWTGTNTTTGDYNSFFGTIAGNLNTTGSNNTFLGVAAGIANTTGNTNTAVGTNAGRENKNGSNNVNVGYQAGYNATGSGNVFVGQSAGIANKAGSANTALGNNANMGSESLTNATAIGANAVVTASNAVVLGNNASVGIGVSAPTAKLEVNGFTKLGSDAPALKTKKFTGTMPGTTGGRVNVPLGTIAAGKVLNVSIIVSVNFETEVPASYGYGSGMFYWELNPYTNVVTISAAPSGSSGVLNRAFRMLVTYEQ